MGGEISRTGKVADFLEAVLISEDKLSIFWQLQKDKVQFIRNYFILEEKETPLFLRLCSLAGDRRKNGVLHEVVLRPDAESWLFKGLAVGLQYVAEIGLYHKNGSFFPLLRSNTVAGIDKAELEADFTSGRELPEWTGNVSTYTYYENLEGSRCGES